MLVSLFANLFVSVIKVNMDIKNGSDNKETQQIVKQSNNFNVAAEYRNRAYNNLSQNNGNHFIVDQVEQYNEESGTQVGDALYSVSQRVPSIINTSYSSLGPTDATGYSSEQVNYGIEWERLGSDAKDSTHSDVLSEKQTNDSNTTCSLQTSLASGSSSSTSNSSVDTLQGPIIPTCIYLHNHTAIMMDIEDTSSATTEIISQAIINCDELGLNKQLAAQVFTLWMSNPLLELQLKSTHRPYEVRQRWRSIMENYSHASYNRQQRDEPKVVFQRNVFYPQHLEEKIKDQKILELLYEEARHNILEGRYPCEVAHYIMLGGIQARVELGPYNQQIHSTHYFREEQAKYLPIHIRKSANWTWLPISSKNSAEVRLLEQFKRIPNSATNRKLMKKYLEFCWSLPFYGSAFFEGQIEQPVRGLISLITHQDIPVLIAINSKGVYVIDDLQCFILLGLRYEELSWEHARPSREEDVNCLPCLFLQFIIIENGVRVSKILQIFSRQASIMDTLINSFVQQLKWKTNDETDNNKTFEHQMNTENETHSALNAGATQTASLPALANKLSKLTLATFDEDGHCIGQMGSWSFSY